MQAFTYGWLTGAAIFEIVLLWFIWDELKEIRKKMK